MADHIPQEELNWLKAVIEQRFKDLKGEHHLPEPPEIKTQNPYNLWLAQNRLTQPDRLLLALSLAPYINPLLLGSAINQSLTTDGDHPQVGGAKSANFRGLLPTAETLLFLLAGNNISQRLEAWFWLRNKSALINTGVITILKPESKGDPIQSGILHIESDKSEEIIYGDAAPPAFSMEFPARKINTKLTWEELVLSPQTREQLDELKEWLIKRDEIKKWGISKRTKRGYRALFFGPPGTGKTLAANLLGRYTNTEVFLVDLSLVVSKYIGETEKNLSLLFDKAQNKNWILFFDEADALFGKRTNVRDAHDKYANQEVSYLLQRVEDFPGLVILASNLKGNIDEAFLRRFQCVIHFPLPSAKERYLLWQKAFIDVPNAPSNSELKELAQKFELSGANIINIVHFACLRVVGAKKGSMLDFVKMGIQRELQKEGKIA